MDEHRHMYCSVKSSLRVYENIGFSPKDVCQCGLCYKRKSLHLPVPVTIESKCLMIHVSRLVPYKQTGTFIVFQNW
jgi:hypothetical protein